ncbi:hypothetical protein ACDQ55_04110 [Chitinophaga sp. 30R24]|uniref:hypothetical protein n=1 Tax=Chitinophaga sp. 30R24 TaxID=3248838 RepID=UPI003B8FB1EC
MKPVHFVSLAPKTILLVFVTFLAPALKSAAQSNSFVYNVERMLKEAPMNITPATFDVSIAQMQKDQLLFELAVTNPENDKLTLYIKDNFNNTLLRESLPSTLRFVGRYNLASLEDGNYTFEIRNGKNKLAEKSIAIKTQTQVNRNVSVIE